LSAERREVLVVRWGRGRREGEERDLVHGHT